MGEDDSMIIQSLSPMRFPLLILLGICPMLIVTLFVICNCFRKRNASDFYKAVPGLKLRFYGLLTALHLYSTFKKQALPFTVYIHQALSGITQLFLREKIFVVNLYFWDVVFLTKAETLEEFLITDNYAAKEMTYLFTPFFGNGLFTSAGEKWKARRKIVAAMFHHDNIKKFIPIIDRESRVLVHILNSRAGEGGIEIKHPISHCAMDIIWATFIGTEFDSQKSQISEFIKAMERVLDVMSSRTFTPWYHFETIFMMSGLGKQFKRDLAYLRSCTIQVIRQNKERKKQQNRMEKEAKNYPCNISEVVMDIERNIPDVTDEDLRDELLSFILAGSDTVSVALMWTLYLIGLYPKIQRQIQEELDDVFGDSIRQVTEEDLKHLSYIECALKESLRLYPSVPYCNRQAQNDVIVGGYKIRKGSIVVLPIYNVHRDPEMFPNPEVFDPDRFLRSNSMGRHPYAYVPFMIGIRNCLGQRFAMIEMKIILANVLRSFSLKSLEHRDKIYAKPGLVLKPAQPLMVQFLPRRKDQN